MKTAKTLPFEKHAEASVKNSHHKRHVVRVVSERKATNTLETARVLTRKDNRFQLVIDGQHHEAKQAAGCLLVPESGDKVLVLREGEAETYILHVLEKAAGPSTLEFPDTVCVRAPEVQVEGTSRLALQGAEVVVHGVKGTVSFLRLDVCARTCVAQINTVRAVMLSLVQRMERCFRSVRNERVRASSIDVRAEDRMSMHANDVEMIAHREVKVDGERINLG
ncbi:DUF3540 domain-containing protein [Desulfovibrio inopinatus]|uniref:DUF3540 domain-containing protein n=1 Tax=Desulfovibrio inopinatus TaxID=102109 RepID=UPI00041A0F58|nr:DUF3540 domain-containing protein [Desulfovibrio inopinatus]